MRILITGHRGFIGSNLYSACLQAGHDARGYEYGETLPSIGSFDWIMHIGAISSTTESNVEKIMRQNYDFSRHLLNECIREGVHFQYSSSASIYGLKTEYSENSPVDPRTPYAWSKYMFERYAEENSAPWIRVQGFRYFNVYGIGEDHKGGQASPFHQFELQARTEGRIRVFRGSENFRRDFIHVSRIVDTHIKFLDVKESGIWNVGTGETKSFLEIAESFGVPIEEIDMPVNLLHSYQIYSCADTKKLHETLSKIG